MTLGVKEYAADYRLKVETYDIFQVQVLLDGTLDLVLPREKVRLNAGDGVVYRLGSKYTVAAAAGPARVLYCTIRGDSRLPFRGTATWFAADPMIRSLTDLLRRAQSAEAHAANPWLLAALGEALAAHTDRLAPGQRGSGPYADYADAVVERARDLLQASSHSGLSPRRLLASIGMSYGHLARLFRARVGASPKEYQVRERLKVARELLDDPSRTVAAVATELHFASPQHFAREFARHLGRSPRQYRRERSVGRPAAGEQRRVNRGQA